MRLMLIISLLMLSGLAYTQEAAIKVSLNADNVLNATAFVDNTDAAFESSDNEIYIDKLTAGKHTISVFAEGFKTQTFEAVAAHPAAEVSVKMEKLGFHLKEHIVEDKNRSAGGMSYMKYIEVDGLYAAKKNEIVLPEEMDINKSNNTSRQIFSKVPGINAQETDAGGLQMGVGARGLDPKRTTNFNTRQDGYDISADALGYPESYYTPPIEAVEKIELVRGAASLQYGTQFGGLLNFKMKRGAEHKPVEVISRQTIGSYQYFGSFNSVGGSKNGWNYYAYYQHKEGSGWRPNSFFNANGAYGFVEKSFGPNWKASLAYTHYYYVAKQPGGLTDRQFETDPGTSHRDRNWFRVNWNVANFTLNGKLTDKLSINSKTFVVKSQRSALGFLGNITRVDTGGKRDLIQGNFLNVGNETRLLRRFDIREVPGAVLVGMRVYHGQTQNQQGKANAESGPTFKYLNTSFLEGSDFLFPSNNASLFTEVLIPLSECWFITPGVRFEHITTMTDGYYTETNVHPLTGEVLFQDQVESSSSVSRNILLGGMGAVWRCMPNMEIYANGSQNYRALNFSDIYVNNPNLEIATDMTDERGYTLDLGAKGSLFQEALMFDGGFFLMYYQDRIGEQLTVRTDESGVPRVVNYRSNIADARFVGFELFEELDIVHLFSKKAKWNLKWYNNMALVDAKYMESEVTAFAGKRVENVPMINYKTGMSVKKGGFSCGVQFNYNSQQFTDATNAEYYADATVGEIPAYYVMDLSTSYTWKRLKLEGSINNLTDQLYFTRRATGYPGPGIIPAERRMFFMTLQVRL